MSSSDSVQPSKKAGRHILAALLAIVVIVAIYYHVRCDRTTPRVYEGGGACGCEKCARRRHAGCAKCARRRSGFAPVPISTCGSPRDQEYAVDMDGTAGTVVMNPYSTQSRVSLERGAESPGVVGAADLRMNPVVGTGRNNWMRAAADPYHGASALNQLSKYELQPGSPDFMQEVGDGAMSLITAISRRPRAAAQRRASAARTTEDELDPEFLTDGPYDSGVLAAAERETMTSTRLPKPNGLTASRAGLGSVRRDPRFEPGSSTGVGDMGGAPGSHAGGSSIAVLTSTSFAPTGTWRSGYVQGFGDGGGGGDPEMMSSDASYD